MFGKKKKPTLEQQLASLAEIYQTQTNQALQLRDPMERYEKLGEIKGKIIDSNEEINKPDNGTTIALKCGTVAVSAIGGFFSLIVNPPAAILTVAASLLYAKKIIDEEETVTERRESGVLSVLSTAINSQQQKILTEAPLEKLQESPKFKEFVEQNPILKERITAEFLRVTARDYKKPLEGKENLFKNDSGFKP